MDIVQVVVSALAVGAVAGLKDSAAQVVKDAYAGLKSLILRKHPTLAGPIDQLQAAPASKARRAVVEEDLGKTDAARDTELLRQAEAVLSSVQTHDPRAAHVVGVDLEGVKARSIELAKVVATGQSSVTGVKIQDAEVTDDLKIKDVRATGGQDPNA